MHDLLIKGGTLIDGTGQPRFAGDIAITGGIITHVGAVEGPAKRVIEADGLLVTPGWVDIHTHYDGQATWDPYMTPSSYHGVTTAVMGSCGVGIVCCRALCSSFGLQQRRRCNACQANSAVFQKPPYIA